MPRISDAERRTSMQSAERLRIDARIKRIESQKARLRGRDVYAGRLAFEADQLDQQAQGVIDNLEQFEAGTTEPPRTDDDPPPRTEAVMVPKFNIPAPSQRANDALAQVTLLRPGGGTSGPGIRFET